jgi:hypothetical protein
MRHGARGIGRHTRLLRSRGRHIRFIPAARCGGRDLRAATLQLELLALRRRRLSQPFALRREHILLMRLHRVAPRHICTGTRLSIATSAPGLG